ncbi:hypothetical protein [Azospirillum doebereinerae]|uniref:Uncharacterized protein n=1 Tax=Azospirillum doebereinerae TaxID=92933 RepID=A0A433J0N8_9PROT|nr:hypothetical protein [Azospirillum doebereinerae]RUQ63056.1 hypothetical protein EJ913_27980 [Azospirillum doebereinerae]
MQNVSGSCEKLVEAPSHPLQPAEKQQFPSGARPLSSTGRVFDRLGRRLPADHPVWHLVSLPAERTVAGLAVKIFPLISNQTVMDKRLP